MKYPLSDILKSFSSAARYVAIRQHLCKSINTTQQLKMPRSFTERVLTMAKRQGIIRPRDLEAKGIPREYLLRLMRQGLVTRTGRGVYELNEAPITEHHSLAVVAKEIPRSVICLLSALRFHELTTQQPSEVWIGIPVRSRSPRISTTAHRLIRYSEKTFKSGVRIHRIEGVRVRIFTPAKTVADCFKYRGKVGIDVAIEALRDTLRQRKATVDEIQRFAIICRVSKIIRPYLEALV
jgi:predicted transcriptional regulator of viral defense system